jgi:hypothetical protein
VVGISANAIALAAIIVSGTTTLVVTGVASYLNFRTARLQRTVERRGDAYVAFIEFALRRGAEIRLLHLEAPSGETPVPIDPISLFRIIASVRVFGNQQVAKALESWVTAHSALDYAAAAVDEARKNESPDEISDAIATANTRYYELNKATRDVGDLMSKEMNR